MSLAVDTDNMRHQRQQDENEARNEAIDTAIESLTAKYWKEYKATGRVDDLDLDERELTFMACELNVSSHRIIIESICRDLVEAEPAEYLNLNWR